MATVFLLALAACRPLAEDDSGAALDSGEWADTFRFDTADTEHIIDDPDPIAVPPDPSCTVTGCVRTERSYGSYSRSTVERYLPAGVTVTNGYEIVVIEYLTEGTTATATVTLPFDLSGAEPADGFPIVVNAHGTVGIEDPCQLSGTISGTGLAALFGGNGAIGVAPDYPGLGTPGFHHYLDAEEEAKSVLDAVRAAIRYANYRHVRTNERAAVVGLSQGGHATLSAAAWHSRYAPELDIRAFAASAPANGYSEQWGAAVAVPGEDMVLHALLAWSFADAVGADRTGMWASTMVSKVDDHLTERCWWSPNGGPEPTLADNFPTEAEDVFSAEFLNEYETGTWDAFKFMEERFDTNRLRPWLEEGVQTAPIAIWQGSDDETVPPYMTEALVDDLSAGGVDVEYHLVDGGTHTTTAFGFLASEELARDESLRWVLDRL